MYLGIAPVMLYMQVSGIFYSGPALWAIVGIWVILDWFVFKHKNNLTLYAPVEQYYECCPLVLFF